MSQMGYLPVQSLDVSVLMLCQRDHHHTTSTSTSLSARRVPCRRARGCLPRRYTSVKTFRR